MVKHNRIKLLISIVTVIIACACGCSSKTGGTSAFSDSTEAQHDDISFTYSLKSITEFKYDNIQNAVDDSGTEQVFLGYNSALLFKTYLFEEEPPKASLSFADSFGKSKPTIWSGYDYPLLAGSVANSNDFITVKLISTDDENIYQYVFDMYEKSGTHLNTIIPGISINLDSFIHPDALAVDASGTIHFIIGTQYYNISNNGAQTESLVLPDNYILDRLFMTSDGKVCFDLHEPIRYTSPDEKVTSNLHKIVQYNSTNNTFDPLLSYDGYEYFGKFYMLDKQEFLFANSNGIYILDDKLSDDITKLFSWEDADISLDYVDDICIGGNETINVIYKAKDSLYYASLAKSSAEDTMTVVDFAISSYGKSKYSQAVADFNKTHPQNKIVLKEDYDKTTLTSKLISGEDPVLIDTGLLGFVENSKLWEPLDVLSSDSDNALNSVAIELGSIDGTLLGIVSDFEIEAMVTSKDVSDWTFDEFIELYDTGNYYSVAGNDYGSTTLATYIFDHGSDDSYYISDGKTVFDSPDFSKLLSLISKSQSNYVGNNSEISESSLSESLCNTIYLKKPAELAGYRIVYGDSAHFVGFPGKTTSEALIHCSSIITVNRNASEAQKEVAFSFLKYLLSYDCQKEISQNVNYGFSVRGDVFDEQISDIANVRSVILATFPEEIEFPTPPDNNIIRKELAHLLDHSKAANFINDQYKNILYEEFSSYFNKECSEDELVKRLSSRIGIYLNERE
ncbi:MAG: hypothetical protein K6G72_02955 [Lachnospiraceae bacterium]|nr:hypothetical protein [Lachnospiraceae bacterium]